MSMGNQNGNDYEVGYGRPPKANQFQKGRSGNPGGRPRKHKGPAKVDLMAILDASVMVTQNGRKTEMHPNIARLHQALKKGMEGDVGELIYLLDQFEKYGAIDYSTAAHDGVLVLPDQDMPWPMAMDMAFRFGSGPWTRRQIAAGRKTYLASRTPEDAAIDEAIGYKDLQP